MRGKRKKILVLRFSAMGDVAMCVPVVESLCRSCPELEIVFASKNAWEGIFAFSHPRIRFSGKELSHYKGLWGLFRLYRELRKENVDAVADLHNVLRTKILRFFFFLGRTPCAHIRKGRRQKRQLARFRRKKFHPLKSTFERYRDVFRALGFDFEWNFTSFFPAPPDSRPVEKILQVDFSEKAAFIGIAPFAKHKGKIYPIGKMEKVLSLLTARPRTRVFLFGGGEAEKKRLETWQSEYPGTVSCAGKLRMQEELVLINRLEVMLSMDSANMHMASLAGTPVVSLWGATHPYAGFLGWGQSCGNAVQIDLPCRPCSVFGNKPCRFGTYACLQGIEPEEIVSRIERVLSEKKGKGKILPVSGA